MGCREFPFRNEVDESSVLSDVHEELAVEVNDAVSLEQLEHRTDGVALLFLANLGRGRITEGDILAILFSMKKKNKTNTCFTCLRGNEPFRGARARLICRGILQGGGMQ